MNKEMNGFSAKIFAVLLLVPTLFTVPSSTYPSLRSLYLKKKKKTQLVLFKNTLSDETSLLTVKRKHAHSFHVLNRLSRKKKKKLESVQFGNLFQEDLSAYL